MRVGPVLALAALLAVPLVASIQPDAFPEGIVGVPTPCEPPGEDRNWILRPPARVTCRDRTIVVQNLTVYEGAELVLDNVELVINATFDAHARGSHGIRVNGYGDAVGGRLFLNDSTIQSSNPDHRYSIKVFERTIVRITNSTITDTYAIWVPVEVVEFTVRDSRLMHGRYAAISLGAVSLGSIFLGGADATGPGGPTNVWIENNFIYNFSEGGITVTGQPKSIQGNTITNCGFSGSEDKPDKYPWGGGVTFMFPGSYAQTFKDNTITNCAQGIRSSSGACVEEAEFRDNDVYNIWFVHATACGDLDGNWWNMDRWDGKPLPGYFFQGPSEYPYPSLATAPTEWSSQPHHPERLPRPVVSWAPQEVHVGDTVRFDASASLPSAAFGFPIESVRWHFGDCSPGAIDQRSHVNQRPPLEVLAPFGHEATGAVAEHTFTTSGHHWVEAVVTDRYGLSRSWRQVVEVQDVDGTVPGEAMPHDLNTPPYMYGHFGASSSSIDFGGAWVDPDGDVVTARVELYRNGEHVPELGRTLASDGDQNRWFPIPPSYIQAGDEWMMRMTACDGRHAADGDNGGLPSGTETPHVLERRLTVPAEGPGEEEPAPGPKSEPEPNPVPGPGPEPEPTPQPETEPERQPDLRPEPGPSERPPTGGESDPTTGKDPAPPPEPSPNHPPVLTMVEVLPAVATSTSNLQVAASASDPDGDDVTVSVDWRLEGDGTTHHGREVPAVLLAKGQTWRADVAATDGRSSVVESRSVVIQNAPPAVRGVTTSPPQPMAGEAFALTLDAVDPDGDDLDVGWSVSGRPVLGNDPPSLRLPAGAHDVRYWVSDGDEVVEGTASITVAPAVRPDAPDAQPGRQRVIPAADLARREVPAPHATTAALALLGVALLLRRLPRGP